MGIFGRLFGGKSKSSVKRTEKDIKRPLTTKNESSTQNISTIQTSPSSSSTKQSNSRLSTSQQVTDPDSTIDTVKSSKLESSSHLQQCGPENQLQILDLDKEDTSQYPFLLDTADNMVANFDGFINTHSKSNDIHLHLKNLSYLEDHVSYFQHTQYSQNEFLTISSITSESASSYASLKDSLFSNISLSTQSDISFQCSDISIPKIAVRTEPQQHTHAATIADQRSHFSVADTIDDSEYLPMIFEEEEEAVNKTTIIDYERHFCELYIEALRWLSSSQQTKQSPAQAFRQFEWIAYEGSRLFEQLSNRTKQLVSFAQYRVGRMLCESSARNGGMEQGLVYLLESSKNGNARSTFILGCYAERRGDLDYACSLYYQAAKIGLLSAKVSFGVAVLFKFKNQREPTYSIQDALSILTDASNQGHAIASLSLALYYEKQNQLSNAIKFCREFNNVSPSSPIYTIAHYQISIIYLKAGPQYADVAFNHMAKAANLNNDSVMNTRFPPALRKMGAFLLKGVGTTRDTSAAFQYIQEAAKLGDEPANIILGQLYQTGNGCAHGIDLSRAMQIFSNYPDNIAAKLSRGLLMMKENPHHAYQEFQSVLQHVCTEFDEEHWDAASIQNEAKLRIAIWEYNGIGGTEKNPKRAFHTLKQLSEEVHYSPANYWLAWAYLEGVTIDDGDGNSNATVLVPKNKDLAFACFLKGAQENQADCQYRVGLMLKDGYANEQYNKANAFSFFLKAASQNFPLALTQVGAYYFSGGVGPEHGRDLEKAFHYFTAAAKHNEPLAIQYLADYLIKNNASGPINPEHIYTELSRAAGMNQDPIAYRMLALVVNSGAIDLRMTFEEKLNAQSKHVIYEDLCDIYNAAKQEAVVGYGNIVYRFALHCLWKAIELNDHSSGQFLCHLYPKMQDEDVVKTLELFEKAEGRVPNKMSLSYAHFLKTTRNYPTALLKYIEVASYNAINVSIGWNSRLEAAKMIVMGKQGKARSKALVFSWLTNMVNYNGKNLFLPLVFLAKYHDEEICASCNKEFAVSYYERCLQYKANDLNLEVSARMRLIELYYNTSEDAKLVDQLKKAETLLQSSNNIIERKSKLASLLYYKGVLALHNSTISNYREKARESLSKAEQLGHILACLELGYLYGTMESKEEAADECFQKVESSVKTPISFKNRIIESMVLMRTENIHNSNDYLNEINRMKLAAGVTYSYYNMERQALDWFKEISELPLAQIMILYYNMKDPQKRTSQTIQQMSDLIAGFEAALSLDYYSRMILSYGQFRLGQCYEYGHGVAVDNDKVLNLYRKACAFLQNNMTYERLAGVVEKHDAEFDLFPTLYNAARNDTAATYELGRYYHKKELDKMKGMSSMVDIDVPCKRAADQYLKAAQQINHPQSCYYYAKYRIHQLQKSNQINALTRSKKAVHFLRIAANKNHGPSYYELGKLEMAAGLFEEGIEDLKEADFLHCGAASYELGELHLKGFTGVILGKVTYRLQQDAAKAFKYYQRAVDFDYPLAMIKVGHFYETGDIGHQDLQLARKWYLQALEAGRCPTGAAEYALGCLEETVAELDSSTQLKPHREQAFQWFQKAAKANNLSANLKIGIYLLHGWVIQTTPENDLQQGLHILENENANGNVLAMKELAHYYEEKENFPKALSYWRNAEVLNDVEALEFFANCFEFGLMGHHIDLEASQEYKARALEAQKQALETQRSTMGFKSDYSEERR
ncbi:hypothetical protein BDF20DRAFT_868925 [Mycotypha africana]|uniref:uncharacterized protein n=1 Tax=Mycotypha africana TaxID=64632 RepID=UPI002300948B|nr:uncharacterized protein BDF20DRAFT_868925 [Mycotypha africana]KAI8979329.1 hypothetical protein BDF20DRAFT_868925 [Mycotypha africana]